MGQENKRIRVMVDGLSRLFPIDNVKVLRYKPDGGADVVVIYPSFNLQGTVAEECRVDLLTQRLRGNRILLTEEPVKEEWSQEEMEQAIERFKQWWLTQ